MVTIKDIIQRSKIHSRKIRESLEIKRLKCDSSKSDINHDGNLVKTNTWALLLRNINDLESALWNQKSYYKADITSNKLL